MTNRVVMAIIIHLRTMAAVDNNSSSNREVDSRVSKGKAGRRCISNGISKLDSIDMHAVSWQVQFVNSIADERLTTIFVVTQPACW